MEAQREFDYDRASQLALLRDAQLPDARSSDGKMVRASVAKSLLRVIDDHARKAGECWAGTQTLAAEANVSPRHAARAVQVLLKLSLITCERRKRWTGNTCRVPNHYRIVWSELSLLCRPRSAAQETALPDDPRDVPRPPIRGPTNMPQEQTNMPQEQTNMPLGAIEAHMKRERSAPPPPTPSLITGWREAEEAFARSGIDQSALLVRIARERGLTPAEALALAGYFAAHAAANEWGAGVLFTRVRNALPGAAVEARWMPPSPAAQARARLARSAEQRDRRARESAAYGIIRAMRTQQRADDAQIRAELAARGLAWPGEAALTHTLTE